MTAEKIYSNQDYGNAVLPINMPAPTNPGDAVNKSYADGIAAGVLYKIEVMAATTAALPAGTYSGAGGGGLGTLTETAAGPALPTIDGYAPVVGDRILVKNEAAGANNGIYIVTSLGTAGASWVLTRTTDAPHGNTVDLNGGASVFVKNGTTNGGTTWVQTVVAITIGTTAQIWAQQNASIVYPISIANGGTGQTTAAAAIGTGGLGAQTAPTGGTGVSSVQADGLARKVEGQIANPTLVGSPYLITHNLGTRAVGVFVLDTVTFQDIRVTWSADTINTVNIRFDATNANTVLVTIIG